MSSGCNDILQMLDYLKLPVMAESLERMMDDPTSLELPVLDFLKQIVSDEYVERHNSKTATLIRLSAISGMMGDVNQLYTHDGRIYNDNIARQVKELSFLTNRRNVCVFGQSGAGKTYMLASLGYEICAKGVKCLYIDYVRLVDTLTMLRGEDIQKYYKKLKKYSSYQDLLIDDFLSGIPSIDNTAVFFQLLKEREKAGNPTIIGTQYDPQEWPKMLSGGNSTQGDADAIRRRLVDKAYLVVISKEE